MADRPQRDELAPIDDVVRHIHKRNEQFKREIAQFLKDEEDGQGARGRPPRRLPGRSGPAIGHDDDR